MISCEIFKIFKDTLKNICKRLLLDLNLRYVWSLHMTSSCENEMFPNIYGQLLEIIWEYSIFIK